MSSQSNVFQNVQVAGNTRMRFRLSPTHVSYANTLRRAILTDVPIVGFRADILADGSTSDVRVEKNTTALSNEMLAHRIGLIPVHAFPTNWDPEEYAFSLDMKNESGESIDITASDIVVKKRKGDEFETVPNTNFFLPDPVSKSTVLLASLKGRIGSQEPEHIAFHARATVGTGRENARFIPTSQCSYRYSLDEDPERVKAAFANWLTTHKKVALDELEKDDTKRGAFEREFKTMEINRCYLQNSKGEPYSFDFEIESIGQLTCKQIVRSALEGIIQRLSRYVTIDSGDLPPNVSIKPADARMNGFDFYFAAEDHTLGNLLQTWIDETLLDTGIVSFVGYKVPHPLQDIMVLRVGVEDGKELTARQAVSRAANEASKLFRGWLTQWAAMSV